MESSCFKLWFFIKKMSPTAKKKTAAALKAQMSPTV